MTEPFLKGPTQFCDDASDDKAHITFDRLLRKYFAAAGSESRSLAIQKQVASQADDAIVVSYRSASGRSRSITLPI